MESTQNIELIIIGFLGTIFTTALIASLWVVIMRSSRYVKIKTLEQQLAAERHLQELRRQEGRTQELERARIARDLHDEIGSALFAMGIFLKNCGNGQITDQNLSVDEFRDKVNATMDGLERIIAQLTPPSLDLMHLTEAIQFHSSFITKATNIQINMEVELYENIGFEEEVQLALYRTVQEILNNAIKHAECDHIEIIWAEKSECVMITISDNGKGFDPQARRTGFGLTNIQSRIEICGGIAKIDSEPGMGTTYHITIPVMHNYKSIPEII